jgi:GNAT superfamily N-acetyltransferase
VTTEPSPCTIRRLREGDRASWQPLWEAYLRFYRAEVPAPVSDATFARLCDADSGLLGLVAVDPEGVASGLAHLVFHPTTWDTRSSCYLQDLFIDPRARGAGLSARLFDAIYAAAHEGGAARVYWHTQQFNGPARSLYDKVGRLTSFVVYRHDL